MGPLLGLLRYMVALRQSVSFSDKSLSTAQMPEAQQKKVWEGVSRLAWVST